MGKRKCDKSEEKIQRKIRKLEQKLSRRKKRRIIYSDEEDEDLNSPSGMSPVPVATEEHDFPLPNDADIEPTPSAALPTLSPPLSPQAMDDSRPQMDQIPPAETAVPEEIELDGDILKLLGDAPKEDTLFGPPIHKDVASRWQEILSKGLHKDIKEHFFAEYLIPSNCNFLLAPSLNPEAKAAISEPLVKRDAFLMQKQKQLGIALSALATTTSMILANETCKQKLLKPISDACRILCDNHFIETKSRRNLIISSTNTQLKDTLIDSPRDKLWLFGENISEKLKAAKSIQKTGNELKSQSKQNLRGNFMNKNNKGRLNFKPQHRKTDKPSASNTHDSSRGRQQYREPPARPTAAHRPAGRSPPPRRSTRK